MDILIAILIFCAVIIIHELGHFTVAKACKMNVNEFSIGMGPAIFRKKFGGTIYSLKLFPIGGSVALDEDLETEDKNSFRNKPVWMRMLVIVAGAIMNLILGLIFCLISILCADKITSTTIGGFHPGSFTSQALMANDEILEIDGMNIWTAMDISFQLQNSGKKSVDGQFYTYDMKVKRDNNVVELRNVKFGSTAYNVMISQYNKLIGEDTSFSDDLREYYNLEKRSYTEKFNALKAENSGTEFISGFKTIVETYDENLKSDKNSLYLDFKVYGVEKNFGTVFDETIGMFMTETRLIWISFVNLIQGTYGLNEISGPIGIVQSVGQVASMGFGTLMSMAALITINVGIFNLFPIPALDGARLLFLIIEAIRRKPIKAEHEGMVHFIGLMALFLLMILVSVNDIVRIFSGG